MSRGSTEMHTNDIRDKYATSNLKFPLKPYQLASSSLPTDIQLRRKMIPEISSIIAP